jgi:hypothetical protein
MKKRFIVLRGLVLKVLISLLPMTIQNTIENVFSVRHPTMIRTAPTKNILMGLLVENLIIIFILGIVRQRVVIGKNRRLTL